MTAQDAVPGALSHVHSAGKLLKADRWWDDKGAPVLGIAYFLLASGDLIVPLGQTLIAMAAFMISFIGVAGFGHVVNDVGDIEQDRAAGKHNTMQQKTRVEAARIILLLLAIAWLPWLLLPANRWNLSLLGLQLLLLTVYAAPPLRLKSRPVAGILTDALYAYTVPALITWTTWGPLSRTTTARPLLLATLIGWSLFAGLRGILHHQYLDAANDAAAGTATFATRHGRERTLQLLAWGVLPAEITCFVAMSAALAVDLWYFPFAVALLLCWRAAQLAYLQRERLRLPWRMGAEPFVKAYGYEMLGAFYTRWFPVVMLAALCLRSPTSLLLALAHVALFRTGLVETWRDVRAHLPRGIVRMIRRLG